MEICRWLFQGFTEIQNGRHGSTSIFWWAQKLKKLVWSIFFNFKHHIPSNKWMCNWFFKDGSKIQNGRQKSAPKLFVGAKSLKLNVRNYSNFTITFPTTWRCAGDFLQFCWNSKWPSWINFNFLRSQKLSRKLFKFYNHILHEMEMCMLFFQGFTEIQDGRHAWTSYFFVGTKTQKLKSEIMCRWF